MELPRPAALRGHERRRASRLRYQIVVCVQHLAHSEIRNLEQPFLGHKQVLRLDVPVQNIVVMQVLDACNQISEVPTREVLVDRRHVVACWHRLSALHKLQPDVELGIRGAVQHLVHHDTVLVVELLHDCNLLLHALQHVAHALPLLLENILVHDFESVKLPIPRVLAQLHLTESTLPQWLDNLKLVHRLDARLLIHALLNLIRFDGNSRHD
mmetsp:Transcript_25799/g.50402  ORF Transcript_25799/g.50402 Transcript_25799/m.50402 type:complete len:212 (+) Transcript_25799:781-1416(+)